ncbi:MAG: hypothetical protein Q9196_001177 [Gyalolechia fulgens]
MTRTELMRPHNSDDAECNNGDGAPLPSYLLVREPSVKVNRKGRPTAATAIERKRQQAIYNVTRRDPSLHEIIEAEAVAKFKAQMKAEAKAMNGTAKGKTTAAPPSSVPIRLQLKSSSDVTFVPPHTKASLWGTPSQIRAMEVQHEEMAWCEMILAVRSRMIP